MTRGWKGSKHDRSNVQFCYELYLSLQKYFVYPAKSDHMRRFDQLSWKTYINMFKDHGGVFLVICRGKGKLSAKRAVD